MATTGFVTDLMPYSRAVSPTVAIPKGEIKAPEILSAGHCTIFSKAEMPTTLPRAEQASAAALATAPGYRKAKFIHAESK